MPSPLHGAEVEKAAIAFSALKAVAEKAGAPTFQRMGAAIADAKERNVEPVRSYDCEAHPR